MRIATWNVNSIRARLEPTLGWLKSAKPDVLLLQEIKCETHVFPALEFKSAGYESHALGQKSYNGVAILSRHKIENVLEHLPEAGNDTQSRYLEATIKGIRVASIYLPNGNPMGTEKYEYKLAWLKRLHAHEKIAGKRNAGGARRRLQCDPGIRRCLQSESMVKMTRYIIRATRAAFRELTSRSA